MGCSHSQEGSGNFLVIEDEKRGSYLWLMGEREPSHVKIEGDIKYEYNSVRRSYAIGGDGVIFFKNFKIEYLENRLKINGKEFKMNNTYVLKPNGTVKQGFIRTFD